MNRKTIAGIALGLCLATALLFATVSYQNKGIWLAFATGDALNFIEVWQLDGGDYVLRANFTATSGSVRVEEDQFIRFNVSIKLDDDYADDTDAAIEYTKVNMTIETGIWNDVELNNTSCALDGGFYYLIETGDWNATGEPVAGTTYNCETTFQGYY